VVLGAGGAQGAAVARRLRADGHRVTGVTRSADRPLPEGVTRRTADLPRGAAAAFDGATHATAVLPLVYDERRMAAIADAVADAAASARLRRLVVVTGTRVPSRPTGVAAFDTRRAAVDRLLGSGVPTVVLRPPLYLENLRAPGVAGPLAAEDVLRYPLPPDAPVPWLAHADLAAAVAAALHRPGIAGAAFDIGGRDLLTGPGLADAFGAVLGRTVAYRAQDPDAFRSALAPVLGAEAAAGVAATYHWAHAHPDHLASDPEPAARALGVEPMGVRDWIAAQRWDRAGAQR
jgi:uncharacterized protein YbjT (DUF2867 family)